MLTALLASSMILVGGVITVDQPAAAAERQLTPEMFGAIGDGVTDDTAPLQAALDTMSPGDTLKLGVGQVYLHTDVLHVRIEGAHLAGPGTLLAADEARSAVVVEADRVVLDQGLTLRMLQTTRRWYAFEQMKLRIAGHTGVTIRDVTVDGSAAAGIYVGGGANGFLLENIRIIDSRADGIQITGASRDGVVRGVTVDRSGDDGVAIVSYGRDRGPVRRVTIDAPIVRDNTWGRGVSVVGGEDIVLRSVTVQRSNSAAIYIAAEGHPFYTRTAQGVRVEGASLSESNVNPTVDHGAVMIYSGRAAARLSDIVLASVDITDTRAGAPFQVAVIGGTAGVEDVALEKFSITGGGRVFYSDADMVGYRRTEWTIDDRPLDDQ